MTYSVWSLEIEGGKVIFLRSKNYWPQAKTKSQKVSDRFAPSHSFSATHPGTLVSSCRLKTPIWLRYKMISNSVGEITLRPDEGLVRKIILKNKRFGHFIIKPKFEPHLYSRPDRSWNHAAAKYMRNVALATRPLWADRKPPWRSDSNSTQSSTAGVRLSRTEIDLAARWTRCSEVRWAPAFCTIFTFQRTWKLRINLTPMNLLKTIKTVNKQSKQRIRWISR